MKTFSNLVFKVLIWILLQPPRSALDGALSRLTFGTSSMALLLAGYRFDATMLSHFRENLFLCLFQLLWTASHFKYQPLYQSQPRDTYPDVFLSNSADADYRNYQPTTGCVIGHESNLDKLLMPYESILFKNKSSATFGHSLVVFITQRKREPTHWIISIASTNSLLRLV